MGTQLEQVAARPVAAATDAAQPRGLWARAVGSFQSAVCGFHGHDPMLQFEQGRMFLRCTSCGYRSPGWETGERRPRLRFAGDAARHQLHETTTARTRPIA
jgi:hypothetical protein